MKTMKKGMDIRRVAELEVAGMVKNGFAFCPKSELKALRLAKKKPMKKGRK